MMATSIPGALWITRALAARDEVHQSAVAAFASRPMRTVSLGRVALPSPGSARVVLCPPPRTDPLPEGGSRLVVSTLEGREIATETLTRDESRGRRCLEAVAHASGPVLLRVELSAQASTRVATVERFTHRRITPALAWPPLAFVLGLALLLFGGRGGSAGGTTEGDAGVKSDESPEAPMGSEPFAPDEPPVRWPAAWALAIGGYFAAHLANAMLSVGWMTVYKPVAGGVDGTTLAVTTLTQHGLLTAVSLAMFGVLGAGRPPEGWRARLGFVPWTARDVATSVGLALALVAVAIASTKVIPDLEATPMGKILERSPARYAIAFGALIAPLSEELFFRGVLVSAFGRKGVWRGVIASVLLFTGAHVVQLWGAWAGLIPICAVGITNAVLRARTGGLSQPWLVHVIYNGALTASLYFS